MRLWGGREEPRQREGLWEQWDAAERREPGSKAHKGPAAPPSPLLPALPSTDLICVNSLVSEDLWIFMVEKNKE